MNEVARLQEANAQLEAEINALKSEQVIVRISFTLLNV
jgi:cell division protein FtsB